MQFGKHIVNIVYISEKHLKSLFSFHK